MNTPSLFGFATSELSQDAFICWLLSYAHPGLQGEYPALHACGKRLLAAFFAQHDKLPPADVVSVVPDRQVNHIDVLCTVECEDDSKYAVVVEDKVGTQQHSGQLPRYKEVAKGLGYKEDQLVCIYFQTGDQSNYDKVMDSGYKVFHRTDFLDVLDPYDEANAILLDYRERLNGIEMQVQAYQTRKVSEWEYLQWVGFFLRLQQELQQGNWDFVNNPGGGFAGYWWGWHSVEDAQLYLQIQQQNLCFKIAVEDRDKRTSLRNQWHKRILGAHGKNARGLPNVGKPQRFGWGRHMTVCLLDGDFRVPSADGSLDFAATVARLQQAMALLQAVAPK